MDPTLLEELASKDPNVFEKIQEMQKNFNQMSNKEKASFLNEFENKFGD